MTVRVTGDVDMTTAPELERALRAVLTTTDLREVDVDLGGVRFCDSSGLRALADAHRSAGQDGIVVRITAMSRQVRLVLTITELLDVLAPGHPVA